MYKDKTLILKLHETSSLRISRQKIFLDILLGNGLDCCFAKLRIEDVRWHRAWPGHVLNKSCSIFIQIRLSPKSSKNSCCVLGAIRRNSKHNQNYFHSLHANIKMIILINKNILFVIISSIKYLVRKSLIFINIFRLTDKVFL